MKSTTVITEAEILERIVAPQDGNLSPEAARVILGFKFDRNTTKQIRQLLQKNNRGTTEGDETSMPAFRTGPVSGCQGGRLIQEEQFGVMAGRHHRPLTAPEVQDAYEPPLHLPRFPDSASSVVQDATVARERAPLRRRNDLAEWSNAILSRHGKSSWVLRCQPQGSADLVALWVSEDAR